MSTGIFSNPPTRLSFVHRHGFKALGLAFLSAGILLGGCNGKLKEEAQALRDQNAELKEKVTSTDSEKAALAAQLQQTQAEKDRLNMELANARVSLPAQPTQYAPRDERVERTNNKRGGGHTETIEISGDVLFASGSATLKPEAKKELNKVLPQIKSANSIRIEGHTDSDPITKAKAKFPTNQALSKARADAVRDYLVSKGVSRSMITTVGKGASEPKSTKKESRRVDIVVAE